MVNENAISNILIDIDFLEEEFRRHGRPDLDYHDSGRVSQQIQRNEVLPNGGATENAEKRG